MAAKSKKCDLCPSPVFQPVLPVFCLIFAFWTAERPVFANMCRRVYRGYGHRIAHKWAWKIDSFPNGGICGRRSETTGHGCGLVDCQTATRSKVPRYFDFSVEISHAVILLCRPHSDLLDQRVGHFFGQLFHAEVGHQLFAELCHFWTI